MMICHMNEMRGQLRGSVLLDIFLIFSAIIGVESFCKWESIVTESSAPLFRSSTVSTLQLLDTTNSLKNTDVTNLWQKDELYRFPYFVLVKVECEFQDSLEVGRNLVLTGSAPLVVIWKKPETGELQELLLTGALVDLNATLSGTNTSSSPCSSHICSPAWLVPLPMYTNSFIIRTRTQPTGVGPLIVSSSYYVNANGYYEQLVNQSDGSASWSSWLGQVLSSESDQRPLWSDVSGLVVADEFLPHISSVTVLSAQEFQDVLILSDDEFNTNVMVKVSALAAFTVDRCGSGGTPNISSAASLAKGILLNTKSGLVLVPSMVSSLGAATQEARVVLAHCVGSLHISPQGNQVHRYAMAVGASLDDGRVWITNITSQTDDWLVFQELVSGAGPCMLIPSTLSCRMQAITSSAESDIDKVFLGLLHMQHSDSSYWYALVQFNGPLVNGSWELVSHFPAVVRRAEEGRDVGFVTVGESMPGGASPGDEALVLHSLAFTRQGSNHLYLWGSHLLSSLDGGTTILALTGYHGNNSIKHLVSSDNGELAFLTSDKQVWYGFVGSHKFLKLYPSSSWNIVHTLQGSQKALDANATALSIFFTIENRLKQVVHYADAGGRMMMDCTVIQVSDILAHIAHTSMISAIYRPDVVALVSNNTVNICSQPSASSRCPFMKLTYFIPQQQTHASVAQLYDFEAPRVSSHYPQHDEVALLSYQAVIQQLLIIDSVYHMYVEHYSNNIEKWIESSKSSEGISDYLYRNRYLSSNIHIGIRDYKKLTQRNEDSYHSQLPSKIYLDKGQSFTFSVILSQQHEHTTQEYQWEPKILRLSVLVSNRTLVEVAVVRHEVHIRNHVSYQVTIQEKGVLHQQYHPGINLYPVNILLQVWNSQFHCFYPDNHNTEQQGVASVDVMLGCPSSLHVVFDIKKSITALIETKETAFDCTYTDPAMPCLYHSNQFYPYFVVQDKASGDSWEFMGHYTLKVIGAGYTRESMKHFSPEEIRQYNSDDMSLIWGPVKEETRWINGYPAYTKQGGRHAISWFCQPNSPCSNVLPSLPDSPHFYFLIRFSNQDVDTGSTLCNFTTEFVLHIHGQPLDADLSLTLVLSTIGVIWFYVLVYFFVMQNDKKNLHDIKNFILRKRKKVEPEAMDSIELDEGDFAWKKRLETSKELVAGPLIAEQLDLETIQDEDEEEEGETLEVPGRMSIPSVVIGLDGSTEQTKALQDDSKETEERDSSTPISTTHTVFVEEAPSATSQKMDPKPQLSGVSASPELKATASGGADKKSPSGAKTSPFLQNKSPYT